MAVYTHLETEQLAQLVAAYDVGELISAKGIAEGVSNSNWLIETTGKSGATAASRRAERAGAASNLHPTERFILTMYERRVEIGELPYFLGLLDHLAARGCPVPRTIHDREGRAFRMLGDKAVALIEFMPGISPDRPTSAQARAVGRALAGIHLAASDFPLERRQAMGLEAWARLIEDCADVEAGEGLDRIDPALGAIAREEIAFLERHWPGDLPAGVIHADLFSDNVLMLGDEVSALIDFYFAANDLLAYDLAVTHAAWCFAGRETRFCPDISRALIEGYESRRRLSDAERAALPVLARGACMRFISSRSYDWLHTPDDAMVSRKDPMEFVRRLRFYREAGAGAFASAIGPSGGDDAAQGAQQA